MPIIVVQHETSFTLVEFNTKIIKLVEELKDRAVGANNFTSLTTDQEVAFAKFEETLLQVCSAAIRLTTIG